MKRKEAALGVFACIGLFFLILDSKTAAEGAQTGIVLCLQVVIPSLFPFFLMTILLTNALSATNPSILRPLGIIFGIPAGMEGILISGFLGGYPAGAQSIYTANQLGRVSDKDAQRLLSFCNNAGPAFLFGMVSSAFPEKSYVWKLWAIHIFSALLVSWTLSNNQSSTAAMEAKKTITLPIALQMSLRAMAMVCGWIVLFRILLTFLQRWIFWRFSAELAVLLAGLLELSNGCCELSRVSDIRLRFLICSICIAFGGLCVTMQTISVTNEGSMRFYFRGKIMQVFFSLILSIASMYQIYQIWPLILLFSGYLLWKRQKNSSIPVYLRV